MEGAWVEEEARRWREAEVAEIAEVAKVARTVDLSS